MTWFPNHSWLMSAKITPLLKLTFKGEQFALNLLIFNCNRGISIGYVGYPQPERAFAQTATGFTTKKSARRGENGAL